MSFIDELKRRNVVRVGIAYVIAAWLLLQLTEVLIDLLDLPDVAGRFVILLLIVGLIPALIFAWAFEMTPDGLKREKDVDRSDSITLKTGRKLDFTIIGVLLLAVGYLLIDKFWLEDTGGLPSQSVVAESSQASAASTDQDADKDKAKSNSIAVLPFANRSNQQDDLFFTDGIHDDLLTQLAKISDLKVISRTSVMEYRDTTKKIPEIAAELGVSTILEGGIQRAGNRIRINAQLIDVNTDEHLWAETFDREMTIENIFDIQSEITRQIVQAVRGELTDEETEVLGQLPTNSLEAYEAYLHARNILNQPDFTRQKFEDTEPWLEKAVELDPGFALAWALLVRTHGQAIWQRYDDSAERLQQLREALSKASEFGPFLPETLAARAEYLYRIENNYAEAEIALRTASQARPGDADLIKQLAFTQRRTGKWEQAIGNLQLAYEMDPEDINARSELIVTLMNMREYARAEPLINAWSEKYPQAMDIKGQKLWLSIDRDGDLAAARNLFDQLEPNGGTPYYFAAVSLPFLERNYQAAIDLYDNPQFMAFTNDAFSKALELQIKSLAYRYMGNAEKADEFAQQAISALVDIQAASSGSDFNQATMLDSLAFMYAQTGQLDKALELSNQACALIPESRDRFGATEFSATRALILAMSGEREEALQEIDRLLSIPGSMSRWALYMNPIWDFFRDDERFNELIKPPNLAEKQQL